MQRFAAWLKRLAPSRRPTRASQSQRARRVFFEPLEDRRLLTRFVVTTINDEFDIDSGQDDTSLSLREAIDLANKIDGEDTITFAPKVNGSMDLTMGSMAIDEHLTITGPGREQLTINADHNSRIFRSYHLGCRLRERFTLRLQHVQAEPGVMHQTPI